MIEIACLAGLLSWKLKIIILDYLCLLKGTMFYLLIFHNTLLQCRCFQSVEEMKKKFCLSCHGSVLL